MKNGIPTFRPIFFAIAAPTYKLAKFFDKLLKPITTNEYTIKDSFSFAKEFEEFAINLIMVSFDVKSLFIKHSSYINYWPFSTGESLQESNTYS